MAKSKLPYLSKRADTDGYFFLRRVPKDLVKAVRATQWRWKLADTLSDARRALPDAIAKTDQLIAETRAGKTAKLVPLNQQSHALVRALLAGKPPAEVFNADLFTGTPEEAEAISELPPLQLAGDRVFTASDAITLSKRLKNTASPQTILGWEKTMNQFIQFIGHQNLHTLSKSDLQSYRDHLLDTVAVSTLKTRMARLAGLFEVAVEEGHLHFNPARGLTKRIEEPKIKVEKVFDPISDQLVKRLHQHNQDVYQLIRWSGMRMGEAAGLQLDNINLDDQLIHLIYLPDRPLKTKYSIRDVPIHPNLLDLCKRLVNSGERPFPMFYKPNRNRWECGNSWRQKIQCNPHLLRHHATTCMRNAGFQEFIIGRALGHEVKGMTAQYGSVDPELIKKAIYSIE